MFRSILFPAEKKFALQTTEPACFRDLNLDQIFRPILQAEADYDLAGTFYSPVKSLDGIAYRQAVLQDLQNEDAFDAFSSFSLRIYQLKNNMDKCRADMASGDSWRCNHLTRGRILACAEQYCDGLEQLLRCCSDLDISSAGLQGFLEYLRDYHDSDRYLNLSTVVHSLRSQFSALEYCMLIKDGTVRVRKFQGEADLSPQILAAFAKFRQGEVKDYRQELPEKPCAQHVEAGVLEIIEKIYPAEFQNLRKFTDDFDRVEDDCILRFSREIRFYLSWLEYIRGLQQCGLPFCFPKMSAQGDHTWANSFFDLALAKNIKSKTVTNDFYLDAPERIIVVTGPNQGGKTTFARAFGQLHYLASLGLCVPGADACLMLPDNVLTHFEREEDLSALNGKLQDDLERLKLLEDQATARSIVVINEIFASTTLKDALLLGGKMMDRLQKIGAVGIVVTFMDELAGHGAETVSMVGLADPDNPDIRTFRLTRKEPDGLAYALSIAKKHGLTYDCLKRRLQP